MASEVAQAPARQAGVWLSKSQASRILGISVPAVDRLIRDGKLRARPNDFGRLAIDAKSVLALAEQSTPAA